MSAFGDEAIVHQAMNLQELRRMTRATDMQNPQAFVRATDLQSFAWFNGGVVRMLLLQSNGMKLDENGGFMRGGSVCVSDALASPRGRGWRGTQTCMWPVIGLQRFLP